MAKLPHVPLAPCNILLRPQLRELGCRVVRRPGSGQRTQVKKLSSRLKGEEQGMEPTPRPVLLLFNDRRQCYHCCTVEKLLAVLLLLLCLGSWRPQGSIPFLAVDTANHPAVMGGNCLLIFPTLAVAPTSTPALRACMACARESRVRLKSKSCPEETGSNRMSLA